VFPIRDVYPGSQIHIFFPPGSRIPDQTTTIKRKRKIFGCLAFFVAIKLKKLKLFYLEQAQKKISGN